MSAPTLLVLAGRPGTGKTTLARGVVQATRACCLRVDAVEAALAGENEDRPVGATGYAVAHAVALSNLLLGSDVVVDAVNPVPEARTAWPRTAERAGARLVLVETLLPDPAEHRRRVEARVADVPGHRVPTWAEVEDGWWVPWDADRDGHRTLVDTTDADRALAVTLALLRGRP